MPRRRRRSGTRLLFVLLVVLLALPTLAWVGASLLVDADAWRPQIIAAVRRTTGRELRLAHLRLVPALTPTLSITDVSLANLPGGSQPEMLRVPHVQVVLSLLPLLAGRVEIARLELERPEILLERDSHGAPNWLLGEALTMAAPANPDTDTTPAPSGRPSTGAGPVVRELRIEDGVVRWSDDTGERSLKLQRLVASAYGVESPVTVTGRATYEGLNLALEAECGPLSRLVDRKAIAPWPLKGTLETPGARLAFSGTLMHPLEGTGYVLALEAATVNLPILDRLVGVPLPPLRQVAIAARVVDGGGDVPEVTGMALRLGDSDLDSLLPGLRLTRAEFSAASLQDKLRGEAEVTLDGTRVHLTTALGPLAALLPLDGRPPALAVEVAAEAGGATLALNGMVPVPWRRDGIDLAITGRIPDGATLSAPGSPPAGALLAALRPALLDGRLVGRAESPGLLIRGLAVTTPEADLSGELAVAVSPRLVVQGSLASHRFDLDALRAALQAQPASPPPSAAPPATGPAARLFPATPLPWPLLSAADLDLRLAVGELRLGGASWRDLAGRVVLQSGRLTLDPLTAAMPGGRAVGHLAVDAAATPPQVALSAHVPGLGLRALLPLLGVPGDAAGTGDLDFDLHTAGRSPRALAAALSGRLGLAVTDADLDNRLLSQLLPALMPQALPQAAADVQALARPGRTRLRCLALRADVDAGLATVPAVGLEAGRFTLQGAGTFNLREETVQIHLRPALRGNVAMLMRLAGPLAAPRLTPELRGAILPNFPGGERGDVCVPSLAAARAGLRAAPPARASGANR